ncbi:hypothetical protein [Aridibaculum aurantiacum]|uniref:hypothetical protein n=1 Tax=Aridibaculum aurantiacum TaxID=2810307 RepID=UPI001A9733E0|nr:hypothetical protein [Aridibaculum aurantiacum]
MLNKAYIQHSISCECPDLRNLQYEINGCIVSDFTASQLLPFLIHQNTVDRNHRIIGLYPSNSTTTINLVPFFVIMGQYRKALSLSMKRHDFGNLAYGPNCKQVVLNGTIYDVRQVNFIDRSLIIQAGTGGDKSIPFDETYKLNWLSNSNFLRDKIEKFADLDQAVEQNIFTLPILPQDNFEAVVLFTNISKFESLLKNVKVAGTDLRRHLNIQKVIFPANDAELRFQRLSGPNTENAPVSLIVARQDSFRAYKSIIEAGKGRFNHVKTIILDDFDSFIYSWERSQSLLQELQNLNEGYLQMVRDKQIKDMYLISRISNLDIHTYFNELKIEYNPWLLQPLEQLDLDEKKVANPPKVIVTSTGDPEFENLNKKLWDLILRLKNIAQESFCNGEIIRPLSCLYNLRTKLNSFFDPKALQEFSTDFLSSLEELRQNWFSGGQDYGLIEDIKWYLEQYILNNSRFVNFKLPIILQELNSRTLQGTIEIVSDNSSIEDAKWLVNTLGETLPNIKILHIHKKEFHTFNQKNEVPSSYIFYLTSDRKTIGAAIGNVLAANQLFILNERSCYFAKNLFGKYQDIQKEVGCDRVKYTLLNLQPPSSSPDNIASGLIEVEFNVPKLEPEIVQNVSEVQDIDLQEVVQKIVQQYEGSNAKELSEKYILLFDDRTLSQVPESRHFYVYEDDKEDFDYEASFRSVTTLSAGDQIIVARRGLQVKDLLEQALRKDPAFSLAIEMDKKWRLLLKNHIVRCRMDLNFFCKKLLDNGFKIGPATVKNWIDGDTQRPDNFVSLLHALGKLGIINNDEIGSFNKHNADLKSIQAGFVRTAIRRLIARLYGIRFQEDEVYTDNLLNDFINHIEIKRISTIYKI